jgi:uncharacterized membrane protein
MLLIFTILAFLAGAYHGFISGFIGEFLFQMAYYESISWGWCFLVGIWGFMSGIYKYKPLKYQNKKNIIYTIIAIVIETLIMMILFILFSPSLFPNKHDMGILLILGLNFFIESLITLFFIVPLILYMYDRTLGWEEKHLYYMLLTHHPITMSDHSFYLKFGSTYIYFCSRCSGVIIGGIVASFFTHLLEIIYNSIISAEVAVFYCIVLPIPGMIDWGTQTLKLRKSNTRLRLFTGFFIGSALHMISFATKYYFFIVFLLFFYFGLVGILIYIGHRKEKRSTKQSSEYFISQNNQL